MPGSDPSLSTAERSRLERLERALMLNGIVVWEWNLDDDSVSFSRDLEPIIGLEVGELHARAEAAGTGVIPAYRELVHPEDQPEFDRTVAALLSGELAESCLRYLLVPPSGESRWIETTSSVEQDDQGRPVRMLGTLRDVSVQIQRERYLDSIAATVPCVIYVYDVVAMRPVWNNDKAARLLGLDIDELAEHADPTESDSVFHPEDAPDVAEVWAGWNERGDEDIVHQTYRVRGPAGEWRWIRTIERVFRREADGRVREIIGAAEDITERRALEEQLLHAAKMESLGRLAGGVAHDFNNLLTSVMGYCDIGSQQAAPEQVRAFNRIRQAAGRGAELAQTLLGVARRQNLEPEWVQVSRFVARVAEVLPRLLGPRIELAVECEASRWSARIDKGQFEQVIFNLASNARDAMPDGGRWRLQVMDRPHALDGEDAIEIDASDTGPGIPREIQDTIFDPFFTTKPRGKGTGLGLPLCYGVVTQAGGIIELLESSERGSTFRILLPARRDPARSDDDSGNHPVSAAGGRRLSGRVLVVDDDENVRFVVSQLLERMGLSVATAEGGAAALAVMAEEDFDLVLSDMVMPGMDGASLARAIADQYPAVPVVIMSGYIDQEQAELPASVVDQIGKPFSIDRMRSLVTEILESRRT